MRVLCSVSEIEYRAKHKLHVMQHHWRRRLDRGGASNAPINAPDLLYHHETSRFGAGHHLPGLVAVVLGNDAGKAGQLLIYGETTNTSPYIQGCTVQI